MAAHIGFIMDQIAGHVTNYRNLRSIVAEDSSICADWHEIYYRRDGGIFERMRKALPFISTYAAGVSRGTLETFRATRTQYYDALYTNTSVFVFFTHVFKRVPTLLEFDSTPLLIDRMPAYGINRDPAFIAKLKWRLTYNAYQAAAIIQVWSHWARESLIKDYFVPAEKIQINPPGINLDYWRPNTGQRQANKHQPLRVLFVGGDFHRKGGQLLLEWYKNQHPAQVELHIVTREDVAAQPGITVYHNIQPNSSELIALYQSSDLFVLPSLAECFGIATVEAMAAGLPVIASDVGGIADIIEPGRNGYIVPGNDIRALTEAVATVLGDQQRRERMGVQSRQLAEERFDLRVNAAYTIANLKRIAQARQPQLHTVPSKRS